MTIDEMLGKIRTASAAGDWRQVQPLIGALKGMMSEKGRALSGGQAAQLVEALAGSPALSSGTSGGVDPATLINEVRRLTASRNLDRKALQASWDSLYQLLADPSAKIEQDDIRAVLAGLKSARAFDLLAKTADRSLARMPDDATTRRLYGQALIDSGQMYAGIEILKSALAIKPLEEAERDEINGLIGRAHKQIYVDHVPDASTPANIKDQFKRNLQLAIDHYAEGYNADIPNQNHWHGINLAALLVLARKDGHHDIKNPTGLEPEDIASRTILRLEPQAATTNDHWVLATLAECYLVRGDVERASQYFGQYIRHPRADNFALSGTVRQLEQVFRLSPGEGEGGKILAALKEAQIAAPEGKFSLDGDSLKELGKFAGTAEHKRFSETIVPGGGYVKLGLLQIVVGRAAAIAALCNPSGATQGTGFIVRGADLKPDWGNDLYLVTNAHVLSDQNLTDFESEAPLRPDTVRIVLEGAGGMHLECAPKARWQSAIAKHDVVIVPLKGDLKEVKPLPLCSPGIRLQPGDPDKEDPHNSASRVSVIGYPLGGPLSLSVVGSINGANGMLVDLGSRTKGEPDPTYLHYRAPTEPGNSGSPVFETESWTVIGLHHEGFDRFDGRPKLDGKPGKSYANEGISIHSIRRELAKAKI